MCLTVMGGGGFVGGGFVKTFYDPAVGNIVSVNARNDYNVYSKDVLYFISTVHNYNVFEQSLLDIETNLVTLMRVLENWRQHPDSQKGVFNFISSWFVYGPQPLLPHSVSEDAPCNPRGFYSITKRCAEQLLISFCETHNLRYRILRLGNVIGLGDKKASPKKNALQYLVNQLAEKKPITVYADGSFYRDYIHISDCVRAIDLVLTKGSLDSIYNVGNGHKVANSFREILTYIARKLDAGSLIEYGEPKKFHSIVQVATFGMDVSKLQSLGSAPEYTGAKLYDALLPERTVID